MRRKSGKELTQLELLKRLNLMGIKYDPTITGKNYYINLYDKEVQSPLNQEKIQKELERDKKYMDYLTNDLRIKKQTSINYLAEKKNHYILNSLNPDKNFVCDSGMSRCLSLFLCFNTFFYITKNNKLIDINVKGIIANLKKSINDINIYGILKPFFDSICTFNINVDMFKYLYIIIYISIVVVLFFSFIKSIMRKLKKRDN